MSASIPPLSDQERAAALDREAASLLGAASIVIENFLPGLLPSHPYSIPFLSRRYKQARAREWLARFEAHMRASEAFTAELRQPEKRGLDKVRDAIKATDGRYNDGPTQPIHWAKK